MNEYDALRAHDPDGWESEPTDADRDAFKRWAIDRFGSTVWARYAAGLA